MCRKRNPLTFTPRRSLNRTLHHSLYSYLKIYTWQNDARSADSLHRPTTVVPLPRRLFADSISPGEDSNRDRASASLLGARLLRHIPPLQARLGCFLFQRCSRGAQGNFGSDKAGKNRASCQGC